MPKFKLKIIRDIKVFANVNRAKILQRFFKTGLGEYGEGDIFWGIKVPDLRKVAKDYLKMALSEIEVLIQHPVHEIRLCGLIILIQKVKKDPLAVFKIYLENTRHINNWDLVDLSAEYIVGAYLFDKDKSILKKLAKSKSLWERRIAIISTSYFIKRGDATITLELAKEMLNDNHDLIHKAVGWMLREVGKRCSQEKEEEFLRKFATKMPRVMLRYAIEEFSKEKREFYLKLKGKTKSMKRGGFS